MAEGMIQWAKNTNNRSMEDVAEDYLEQLIGLNLIQVMKRRSDGGAKSCCIHGFIRNLCIKLVEKEKKENLPGDLTGKFFSNWQEDASNSDTSKDSYRHVSSISWFSQDTESFSEEKWKSFFRQFPSLKVLNFGEGEVGKLPEAITNKLFHLKYLRVKSAKNMRVPKSIFSLRNLQSIDLRTTIFPELPKGIWKMQQLRHLYLDGPSRLPKVDNEDFLPNLQTLSYIITDFDDDIHISEKAPNLRKLGLYRYQGISKNEQEITFNLPHLQSLKFAEECTFEEPIELPKSITKIIVKRAHLQQNAIKIFEKLPNLQILKLMQTSFDDNNLIFGENSFPQLQLLKFEDSKIVTWRLEKGAIPNLHHLVISKCPELTEPPTELRKVNELQELELIWTSPIFAKKLYDDLNKNKGLKLEIYPPLSSTSSS